MANTSQGPAVTSANIPKPVAAPIASQNPAVQATAAKVAASAVERIVAAPLIEPDFVQNIKLKRPDMTPRWILHTLYMRDGGQNILRFEKAKTQGYVVVTKDDLAPGCELNAYSRDGGTKFVNGDLILMMISKAKYQGAILYREKQAAQAMLSTENRGRSAINHLVASKVPRSQASKVSVFDPSADLQRFVNDASDPQAQEFAKDFVESDE